MITKSDIKELLVKNSIPNNDQIVNIFYQYATKGGATKSEMDSYFKKLKFDVMLRRAKTFIESDVLSYTDFEKILYSQKFNLSRDEVGKKEVYRFFSKKNYSADEVKSIINGAKRYAILASGDDGKYIRFADVKNVIAQICQDETNHLLHRLKQLDEIERKFKEYFVENNKSYQDIEKVIRPTMATAQRVMNEENADIRAYTDETIQLMYSLASIYNSLTSHMGDANTPILLKSENEKQSFIRVVDAIMVEKINKMVATSLNRLTATYGNNQTLPEVFNDFLDALIEQHADIKKQEVFSSEDVRELLLHTPSLVFSASRKKLDAARGALNFYIDEVLELSHQKPTLEKFSQKIEKFNSKKVFLRAGTVLNSNPRDINATMQLLLGKPVGKALISPINYKNSVSSSKAFALKNLFPEMKIEGMTLEDHLYILEKRNTIFSKLSPAKMYDATKNILEAVCKGYGVLPGDIRENKTALEQLGFNCQNLYTNSNIFNIFPSDFTAGNQQAKDNFASNISLIGKIVGINEIQKIIRQNFNFLVQDSEQVASKIKEIIATSKDDADLNVKFTAYINTHPTIYTGKTKPSAKTTIVGRRKKTDSVTSKKQIEEISFDADLNLDSLRDVDLDAPIQEHTLVNKLVAKTKPKKKKDELDEAFDFIATHRNLADIFDEEDEEKLAEEIVEVDETEYENQSTLESLNKDLQIIMNMADKDPTLLNRVWINSQLENVETAIYKTFDNPNLKSIVEVERRLNMLESKIKQLLQDSTIDPETAETLDYMLAIREKVMRSLNSIIGQTNEDIELISEVIKEESARLKDKKSSKMKDSPTLIKKRIQSNQATIDLIDQESDPESYYKLINLNKQWRKDLQTYEANSQTRLLSKLSLTNALSEYQQNVTISQNLHALKTSLENIFEQIENARIQQKADESENATTPEEFKETVKKLEKEIETKKQEILKQEQNVLALEGQIKMQEDNITAKFKNKPNAINNTSYKKLEEKIERRKKELAEAQAKLDDLNKELAELEQELDDLKSVSIF